MAIDRVATAEWIAGTDAILGVARRTLFLRATLTAAREACVAALFIMVKSDVSERPGISTK